MRATALVALVASAALTSCPRQEPPVPDTPPPAQPVGVDDAARRAREIFERLTPPEVATTSEIYDAWIREVREMIEAAHEHPREVGLALLRLAMTEELAGTTPRRLAIEAGARSARTEASQLLVSLVREWGPPLELREAAVRALPHADPARGVEVLGALLRERPRETLPPSESILQAYIESAQLSGTDPVPVASLVATNLEAEGGTRVAALRHLGRLRGEHALRTLEEVVIETTANSHIRRVAAQELLSAAPPARACAYFRQVALREADSNMLQFFDDLIERNCP